MSQGAIVLPNTGTLAGLDLVNDINAANATLNTSWLGTTAPASPVQGQKWLDSSVANRLTEKLYSGTAWIITGNVYDTSGNLVLRRAGGGHNTIASAATTDLGSLNESGLTITGTTTITSFGSSETEAGELKFCTLGGAITLTYNATSLILPGGANIVGAAGDTFIAEYLGSGNWRVLDYTYAAGNLQNITSVNGGSVAGFRNRIHNGDFRVAQRGTSGSLSGSGAYSLDRWVIYYTGTAPTWSQGGGATPYSQSANVLTIAGAAGNTAVSVGQKMSSADTRDLAGNNITISYWVLQTSGSAVNVQTNLQYANATDNFSATTNVGTSAGTSVPNNTWTKVFATFALPAGAIYGLLPIAYAQGTGLGAGAVLDVGNFQLEQGSVATAFEQRPFQVEQAICQLYYWATGTITYGGYQGAGGTVYVTTPYPVKMRAAPSAAIVSPAYANASGAAITYAGLSEWCAQLTITAAGYGYTQITSITFSSDL